VATDSNVSVIEDQPSSILLTGIDPDGDPLSFQIVASPQKGFLSGVAPNLLYSPNRDVNGSDSFSFVVNDGKVESAPATVTIQIDPRNDAPTISAVPPQVVRKNMEIGPFPVRVEDADRPISDLRVTVASSVTSLVLPEKVQVAGEGTNRVVSVLPEPGATGTTVITISVSDGQEQAESSFTVTVTNIPPVAVADVVTGYGTSIEIPTAELTANDLDEDGDPLRVVSVSPRELGGTVQLENGIIVYRREAETTRDAFDYTLEDSSGAKAVGSVTLSLSNAPAIESISATAAGVTLRVRGAPLRQFRVQSSMNASTWTLAGQGTTDASGQGEFHENGGTEVHHRFYRTEWP
jgi:large repetitive protein